MSAPRSSKPSPAPVAAEGTGLELMQKMGSPIGFDPIPPSQYLYDLDDPEPVHRAVAWLRSNTIRLGHRRHYAVDRCGNVLTIQNMANDSFKGDWANANRAWQQAESQKLVAKDEEGRLCLCGNVPSREQQRNALKNQPNTGSLPVCTDWSKLCTDWQPPSYIEEALKEAETREDFARRFQRFLQWKARVEADAIAGARAVCDREEERLFGEFAIKRRKGGKSRDLKAKPLLVKVELIAEPEESVQVEHGQADEQFEQDHLYNRQNGGVQKSQTEPSLYSEDRGGPPEEPSSSRPVTTPEGLSSTTLNAPPSQFSENPEPTAAPQPTVEERREVSAAMAEYCGAVDADAVKQMIRRCRQVAHDATSAEICHFIAEKGLVAKSKDNPTGFLLTAVPNRFDGDALLEFRSEEIRRRSHQAETESGRQQQYDAQILADIRARWDTFSPSERADFLDIYHPELEDLRQPTKAAGE